MVSSDFAEIENLIAKEAFAHVLIADNHDEGNLIGRVLPEKFLALLIHKGLGGIMVEADQFDDLPLLILEKRTEFNAFIYSQVHLDIQNDTCSGLLCLANGPPDFYVNLTGCRYTTESLNSP
jgi:hypothetical protein